MRDQHTQPWKKIAESWLKFGDGPRPSKQNIADMEQLMLEATKGQETVRALVMGSTPEIRDMLARHNTVEVTLIDVNVEMTLAMTEVMKEEAKDEVWMIADWRTGPLRENYYDVAFGDFIKGNLPFDQQPALYGHIASLLKDKGVYIERVFSYEDEIVIPVDDIVKEFSGKEPSYTTAQELWGRLCFMTGGEDRNHSGRAVRLLAEYTNLPNIPAYIDIINEMIQPGKVWTYELPWEQDKVPITTYFDIEKEVPDDTFFKDMTKVYMFCKK